VRIESYSYPFITLSRGDRHPEIMEMGWKHLGAKLKTDRTKASVLELINSMNDGNAAHRANSLKFGLYNALRQKDPAKSTLALLRCCDENCPANKRPISYNDLKGRVVCIDQRHRLIPSESSLKCSECGHVRIDHYTWCRGCRRLFE
jgi:hypothetical protein